MNEDFLKQQEEKETNGDVPAKPRPRKKRKRDVDGNVKKHEEDGDDEGVNNPDTQKKLSKKINYDALNKMLNKK